MLFGKKEMCIKSLKRSALVAMGIFATCNEPVWAISDDHVLEGGFVQYGAACNKYLSDAGIDPVQRFLIRYSLVPLPGYTPSTIAPSNMRTPIAGFYKRNSESSTPNPTAHVGDVDFGPYMIGLQRKIKRNWFPAHGSESEHVTLVFKVIADGTISNLKLVTASGVPDADEAGLKAVEHAAPFSPLPAGAPKSVEVQFTFDYNVFNRGGASTSSQPHYDDYGYGTFLDILERRIKKSWIPPKGEDKHAVVVLFSVDRAGKISDINLFKSSGVSGADEAAIKAVREAGIVGTPPKSSGEKVNVEFTFDHKLALIKEL